MYYIKFRDFLIGIDVARHQISITGDPTIEKRKIFSNIDDDISRCNFVTNLSICQWTFAIEFDTFFASTIDRIFDSIFV